jgi:hypothetical protein
MMSNEEYIKAINEIEEIRALMENSQIEVSRYLKNKSLAELFVLSINHDTGEISQLI